MIDSVIFSLHLVPRLGLIKAQSVVDRLQCKLFSFHFRPRKTTFSLKSHAWSWRRVWSGAEGSWKALNTALVHASRSPVVLPSLIGRSAMIISRARFSTGPGRRWPDHSQRCLLPPRPQPAASSGSLIAFCWAIPLMHPSFRRA